MLALYREEFGYPGAPIRDLDAREAEAVAGADGFSPLGAVDYINVMAQPGAGYWGPSSAPAGYPGDQFEFYYNTSSWVYELGFNVVWFNVTQNAWGYCPTNWEEES